MILYVNYVSIYYYKLNSHNVFKLKVRYIGYGNILRNYIMTHMNIWQINHSRPYAPLPNK